MVKDKELQIRLTHADCINRQNQLMRLLKRKIERNVGLSHEEAEYFPEMVANSLLSHGFINAYHTLSNGTKIPMGSVHTFALRMLDLRGSKVTLSLFNKKYIINISDLWRTLYNYFIRLFPFALEESLHISREVPMREESSSYIFKAKDKL